LAASPLNQEEKPSRKRNGAGFRAATLRHGNHPHPRDAGFAARSRCPPDSGWARYGSL